MLRYLPAAALVLLAGPVQAQTAQRTPQENMRCAAAALALQDLLAETAAQKAHYRQQAEIFVQPIEDAVATDEAAEERMLTEFRDILAEFQARKSAGAAAHLVASYHEFGACGGKNFKR